MSDHVETEVEAELRKRGLDANRIAPRIYQGSQLDLAKAVDVLPRLGFGHVVFCALEEQPDLSAAHALLSRGVTCQRCPLDDTGIDEEVTTQLPRAIIAAHVSDAFLTQNPSRVLVVCHQGRNRSGLVTAILLWMRGVPMERAIAEVKKHRRASGNALANQGFIRALLNLEQNAQQFTQAV